MRMAIVSVKHKALRRLIERGDRKGFAPEVAEKLEDMLTIIQSAHTIEKSRAFLAGNCIRSKAT